MFDFAYFSITNRCNLACKFCYADANNKKYDEINARRIARFFRKFFAQGGKGIQLTGGEIFLRKDVGDIIASAIDCGLHVSIITNGTLMEEKTALFCRNYDLDVTISLDGPPDIHDRSRGVKGTYEKVMKTVEMFRQNEIPFNLQSMVFPRCIDPQVAWLHDFSLKYAPKKVRLADVSPEGRGKLYGDIQWKKKQVEFLRETACSLTRAANYHTIFCTNVMCRRELEYFYRSFTDVVKPWIMPDGSTFPFMTSEIKWRLGCIDTYPEFSPSVSEAFRAVCEKAYNRALALDYFSPFTLLSKIARSM